MAKKPKKAPAAEGEGGEAQAPKSKKKLIIMVAGAVLLLGGAGGGYVMKKKKPASEGTEAHGGSGHGEGGSGAPAAKQQAAFLDVREMILNLTPEVGADKARFAKLKIVLELKDGKVEGEVKPLLPRVEDTLQIYLREVRASDLSGSVGLYRLREELLRRVNIALYPTKVEAVLFKDVIVQ